MAGSNWMTIREQLYGQGCRLIKLIKAALGNTPSDSGPGKTPAPTPPPATSFLREVAGAEEGTPLPSPPPPMPNPNDPKYAGDPGAYEKDKQAAETAAAAFATAAKARGGAVAQVISKWLVTAPYAMFQELLAQPRDAMPIFKPAIGPVIVMRHPEVIRCLERTDLFTVDPYAAEMARATDDKTKHPEAYSHFMLGTDRDDLYRLDDVILRRAVSRSDEETLSRLTRDEAERWTHRAQAEGIGGIDVVPTLAKFVPLRIVGDYLGVHYYDFGTPSVLPGLRGGDRFPLDPDLQAVFSFGKITEGIVPTADDLFIWVKDAFRNIFNNFSPAHPLFAEFRERGVIATEYLSAYVFALLKHYKERLRQGETVPDTMLTRLLRMQLELERDGETLTDEFAARLGTPLTKDELAKRLSDSMIRSNVFGTAVGAVVNPQEATARILDSMLRLKDGEYEVLNGSSYEQAVRLANIEPDSPDYAESLAGLRKYALEALRLQPQGEVLLRLCVKDNTELGGVPLRAGTLVFAAYAAAMRDPETVPNPSAFDITRDERLVPYLGDRERAHEAPQSQIYLQHGYGRHKCLGRYASEITMRESLRAMLRLGSLERRGSLEMDEQNLYAMSLRIGFR
ncbi:cytochrome P450 [Methylocaldum sp. GT1TLB]|uniref:cytochrome P450 n=1 Tax=Methylocaldum sp. GT1TLB TaxID=3438965 RepID=UPI003DA15F0A